MNRYPEYKKVDLPWLKEVPSHWNVQKLKHNIISINGFAFKSSDFTKDGIRVIRITDFNESGFLSKSIVRIDNLENISNKFQILNKDILLCLTGGTVGKTYYVKNLKEKMYINQRVAILRAATIYVGYLKYIMLSHIVKNKITTIKSSLNDNISTKDIEDILIPFPPLQEQEKIANYLDWKINEIDGLIEVEREKIREVNVLKINAVAELLKGIDVQNYKKSNIEWIDHIPSHWDEVSIRACVKIIRGNSTFTKDDLKNKEKYVGLQYGKVYKSEIIDSRYNFYVGDEFYKASQVVNKNDIILVSTSETIEDLGHTSYYDRDDIGLIGGEQILIKPLKNIDSKYLFYLSKIFRKQLQRCATGIKVYRFKISDLKQINIPLPPIQEQKKIVSNIESTLKLLDKKLKSSDDLIKELEVLKQSLISEVVTGQIDVRNILIPTYEKVNFINNEVFEDGD